MEVLPEVWRELRLQRVKRQAAVRGLLLGLVVVAPLAEELEIHRCIQGERWWHEADLWETPNGWVHRSLAIALDVPVERGTTEFNYAPSAHVVKTYDDRVIFNEDSKSITWHDGKDYILHKDDIPEDILPGVTGASGDAIVACTEAEPEQVRA